MRLDPTSTTGRIPHRPHKAQPCTIMASMARSSLHAVLLIVCCTHVIGQEYFLADQVFDAFTFEGQMEPLAVQNLEITLEAELGGNERWAAMRWMRSLGWHVWAKYYLRVEVNPTSKHVKMGVFYTWNTTEDYYTEHNKFVTGSGWESGAEVFSNLPLNWHNDGTEYYWKLQVEEGGYRLHFNDLQVSTTIPQFNLADRTPSRPCCLYPLNQNINEWQFKNMQWGGGTKASFERDAAALFTRDFPCTDPCKTLRARWLFKCDATDKGPVWNPSANAQSVSTCSNTADEYKFYQAATYPNCHLLTYTIPPLERLPAEFNPDGTRYYKSNWCETFFGDDDEITCAQNPDTGIWYDNRCEDPSAEYLKSHDPTRRAEMRRRIQESRRRMAGKGVEKSVTVSRSRRSATGYKTGKASGSIDDRHKARNEAFTFNHRYMHPVCWDLEELMYLNQNSEHFPALFYWCYDAIWCFSKPKTCSGSALMPRNVYEARLNSCLGVRGTVWSTVQIQEVLLNNFSNASFELNVTNNTIYAVEPIPPEELEDNEPTFITRLPLYQSIFGLPNCSSENNIYGECFFAEGVPDHMYYRYKGMEFLKDWMDSVNYNAYLSTRRRVYGIKKSRFDHKQYCETFGHMCDKNALCESRRKWPGYRCKCDETKGFYGDGYFCTQAHTFAYVKFKIFTTVGINATLERIAEKFEAETGTPKEALDISSSIDVGALETALLTGGPHVSITMKYPTSDNQYDFDGWTALDNSTTPTKNTALKTVLSKRKRYAWDPDQPIETFSSVDRWNYGDVEVFQHPTDLTNFKIRHPAPSLAAFTKYTQFAVDVTDGDSSETGVLVEVGDEETMGSGDGALSKVNKEVDTMQAAQGVLQDASVVQPVSSEPSLDALADSGEGTKQDSDSDSVEAPILFAGGSVAGVVVLAVVGWTMQRKSSTGEKEAAVMAVHDLKALEQTTIDVEGAASDDGDDEAPNHSAKHPEGSIKDRWRSSKAAGEDSFTLSQDRSGIWSGDDAQNKSRPDDSFKKAQRGSGIWNR